MSLKKSPHLTSVTEGVVLSDGIKLPEFIEYPKFEGENIYKEQKIIPEQESLLGRPNSDRYLAAQEK